MIVIGQAPPALLILFLLALAAAALVDAIKRQVPNLAVIAVALGGIAGFVLIGQPERLWEPLLGAIAVLAIGTLLFARGLVGGGDVKLLAATCMWYSLRGLPTMLVAVVIAGGVLAAGAIVVRLARGRGFREGGGIPYAVAIAAGAAWTVADIRLP